MWPIVLAFGSIGIFLALARSARADGGVPSPALPSVPGALVLPSAYSEADHKFVMDVAGAIAKGTATLEMALKALPIALKFFPETAIAINRFVDIEKARRKKKGPPNLVSQPDKLATDIPVVKGKPAWYFTTKKGMLMAIPNFKVSLVVFQTLQRAINAKADGRIGPNSLQKFAKKMKARGFTKYPRDIKSLAANAVKYTEILVKKYPPTKVGGTNATSPFPEASQEQWLSFVRCVKGDKEPGDITDNGQMGMFGANARRLGELGIMSDVRQITIDENDKPIYMGIFKPPIESLEQYLSKPRLQYKVFVTDMKDYQRKITTGQLSSFIGSQADDKTVSLSGLLGLVKQAGLKGAKSWLTNPKDHSRFPHTTAMFNCTNGLF